MSLMQLFPLFCTESRGLGMRLCMHTLTYTNEQHDSHIHSIYHHNLSFNCTASPTSGQLAHKIVQLVLAFGSQDPGLFHFVLLGWVVFASSQVGHWYRPLWMVSMSLEFWSCLVSEKPLPFKVSLRQFYHCSSPQNHVADHPQWNRLPFLAHWVHLAPLAAMMRFLLLHLHLHHFADWPMKEIHEIYCPIFL